MYTPTVEHLETQTVSPPAPLAAMIAASKQMRTDRAAALATLRDLFRGGATPVGLAGPHTGLLVTTTFGPRLDRLTDTFAQRWLLWKGKQFALPGGGDNIWQRFPGAWDPFFWRLNRLLRWGATPYGPRLYRAFPFRTDVGPGVDDPDCTVLKIIYDARPNPWPVRRVLDELVDCGDGVYLGKAHGRDLRGRWRLVAYFALIESGQSAAGSGQ
jgi:hypothetical protein